MGPIIWSLDNPEPGMEINPSTGMIIWGNPVPSPFLYTIRVRATNDAGNSFATRFIGVEPTAPQIASIANRAIPCHTTYTGPTPALTSPVCMEPVLNWSIDAGPPGMTIDHDTGVVLWPVPLPSPTPVMVTIRATNAVGNGTKTWTLLVTPGDLSGDGSTNLFDYRSLWACLSGPDGGVESGCECGDADLDDDIDLADCQAFQNVFGP
jgi:hypothetical protein